MAVALKRGTFHSFLVYLKCVEEAVIFMKNCKQTANNGKQMKIETTHFGFARIGTNMHPFSSTAIYFWILLNGTSCFIKELSSELIYVIISM